MQNVLDRMTEEELYTAISSLENGQSYMNGLTLLACWEELERRCRFRLNVSERELRYVKDVKQTNKNHMIEMIIHDNYDSSEFVNLLNSMKDIDKDISRISKRISTIQAEIIDIIG